MRIFALYQPERAKLLRVWADSWRASGWEPRLLLPKHRKTRKMRVVPPLLINYGLRPRRKGRLTVKKWGDPGWQTAKLVLFPAGATAEHVFNCGRPLVK